MLLHAIDVRAVIGALCTGLAFASVAARADRPLESNRPDVEASGNDTPRFIFSKELGDVHAKKTTNEGPLHFFGSLGVSNADYSRGRFDDIPQSFDVVEFPFNLSAVFELPQHRQQGAFNDFAVTIGAGNDVSRGRPPGLAPGAPLRDWYESDHYLGVTAHIVGEWVGGLTYAVFTSPDGVSPVGHEAAVAARYTGRGGWFGRLSPQFRVAVPTDSKPGIFTDFSGAPSFGLAGGKRDGRLAIPFAIGIGTGDYYGPGTDSTGYGSLGISYTRPFGSKRYGIWSLSVGVDAVYRSDAIVSQDPAVADHDNVIFDAALLVHFYY